MANACRKMQGHSREIFELLEFPPSDLDALDAPARDAIDDLVASSVLVFCVLLARTEDGLEYANIL